MAKHKKKPDTFEADMMSLIGSGLSVVEALAQYGFENGVDAEPEVLRERNVILVKQLQIENTFRKSQEKRGA